LINRIALNLLKHDKTTTVGIRSKPLVAGWDNNYVVRLLRNQDASALTVEAVVV